jgi:hypothetical protein
MGRRPFIKKQSTRMKPETTETVEQFLARGGAITVVPAANAFGWHGKEDPAADVQGMVETAVN